MSDGPAPVVEPGTASNRARGWVEAWRGSGPRLWKELLVVLGFYLVYSWVRNQFGSAAVEPDVAFDNARRIIDLQDAMGMGFEDELQGWFLDWGWFLRFWNIFYGTLHFVVTGFAMVYLYRRDPAAYPRWRSIGLGTTGLALVGFAAFPLMPPRLLGSCGEYGACVESVFVDTVEVHGGWWTFSSGAAEQISNQYAAMPSLHFAWAFWSFLVLAPRLKNRAAVAFMWAYPWLTVFAIVVTANHYWIDAVGGGIVLLVAWWVATRFYGRTDPQLSFARGVTGTENANSTTDANSAREL